MKLCPTSRISPTKHPNPTAASHAPTLRKMTEKKSSLEKQSIINIKRTIHSKVRRRLNTFFFLPLKLASKINTPKNGIFTTYAKEEV